MSVLDPIKSKHEADPRDIIKRDGFLPDARDLADTQVLTSLIADTPKFDAAADAFAKLNLHRVPYLITDAIKEVAYDRNITRVIERLLHTDRWVMWGSNIRRSVPNEAHRWHVDLESLLWPSVTVAIGLENCEESSATWFIPGSNRIDSGPGRLVKDCTSTSEVLAKAMSMDDRCEPPRQINAFRCGSFYVFDGKCWHRANVSKPTRKSVLYLHYQRADAKRIPHMLDYKHHRWSMDACPFIVSPRIEDVNTAVYRPPLRHLIAGRLSRLRSRSK